MWFMGLQVLPENIRLSYAKNQDATWGLKSVFEAH